jgi:outer membrane protein
MIDLKVSLKMLRATCAAGALLAGAAASTSASAADLFATKEPLPTLAPVVDDFQPFFVKVGAVYVVNTSSSRLYGPLASNVVRGDLSPYPSNVGATLSNIVTADFAAGIYVTPNLSINIATGVPQYVSIKTKGFNPFNPPLTNGAKLGEGLLSLVPVSVTYHFNQFGPIQPYLGVGITPVFSLGNRNAFLTGISVPTSIGGVAQAGVDYMFDRHWGVSFDVKKIFTYAESTASGVALLPGAYAYSTLHTKYQPWTFALDLVYRFGGHDVAPVVAKY